MQRNTVSTLLRTTQAHCLQLCEKETLDDGIIYYSMSHRDSTETNQFREIITEDAARLPQVFDEVEQWFGDRGLTCQKWAPAEGTAPAALEQFLAEKDFAPREHAVWRLTEWQAAISPGDFHIVPARAVRAQLCEALTSQEWIIADAGHDAGVFADRLDDPQYDTCVALVGGAVVGLCTLYQVGDIGRLMNLNVIHAHGDSGLTSILMANALTLARRLSMRVVCALSRIDDAPMTSWLTNSGFTRDGSVWEFERSPNA